MAGRGQHRFRISGFRMLKLSQNSGTNRSSARDLFREEIRKKANEAGLFLNNKGWFGLSCSEQDIRAFVQSLNLLLREPVR